ncbi:MAG: WYL domain-containing protein [Chloroflexota bacterium]|jgi:predicted DNA-binding transcriptional regulator YafY|nr:MAG: WYL domain-containing protein [Chloroflexota bacterium]
MNRNAEHASGERFDKSDRSARLLRTLKYVEGAGEAGIRPEDLARRLGVSRRTAYRDLKALEREVEVPIWNSHGRWGVTSEGLLPALRFSRDEALSLVLAARLLAKFSTGYDPEFGAALMKLGGMLDEPLRSSVERTVTQLSELNRDTAAQQRLRLLATAWVSGRVVEFDYAAAWSNAGAVRTARVHPYLIEPSSATLATYLIGYDETRKALRTFRADRITNIKVTSDTFVQPKDVDLEHTLAAAWDIVADQPLEEIVVRFSPAVAARVAETRWHPSQTITNEPGGSLVWKARVSGSLEVRSWILGWGDGAEVLRPETLRADVARTHATAAATYTARG